MGRFPIRSFSRFHKHRSSPCSWRYATTDLPRGGKIRLTNPDDQARPVSPHVFKRFTAGMLRKPSKKPLFLAMPNFGPHATFLSSQFSSAFSCFLCAHLDNAPDWMLSNELGSNSAPCQLGTERSQVRHPTKIHEQSAIVGWIPQKGRCRGSREENFKGGRSGESPAEPRIETSPGSANAATFGQSTEQPVGSS
jgi:hypothetical protein